MRLYGGLPPYAVGHFLAQLVAVVPGAVWYATGYLHSLYTAAGHSILAFFGVFALRGLRHRNGSLVRLVGMGSAPADCLSLIHI